ncbi:MAG: DUF3267 domain-containing protein [Aggregatilineales bacterium]
MRPSPAEPFTPPPGARDVSIPLDVVLRRALLPALSLLLIPLAVFAWLWGVDLLLNALTSLESLALALLGFALLIVAHELVHAIGWVVFGRLPLSAIRFGVDRKTLSPYACALLPMPAGAYRVGAALPLLVTGVVPWLLALLTGSGALAVVSALLISGAVGDLLVLSVIRSVPAQARVIDHPSNAGCLVLPD